MTHLHFLATERSKNKLTDIGEESNRIFVIGAPGFDDIFNQNLLSDRKIREKYKINFQKLFALVLQHPATEEIGRNADNIKKTLEAVQNTGLEAIVIYPNANAESRAIIKVIENIKIILKFIKVYRGWII